MNAVYYGNHAYGIEAAAQTYFSRRAQSLTLDQAALLAGIPQAPSVFDPITARRDALERRDEVLRAMLDNGALTRRQYTSAMADRQLHLVPGRLYTRIREPYFFSYVRDQLIAEYGANTVRTGGLQGLHDDRPAPAGRRPEGDRRDALLAHRPGLGARLDRSFDGRDQGHDGSDPGKQRQPVQPGRPGEAAGGLDLQDVRPRRQRSTRGSIPTSTYYVSAPFHYQPDPYSPAWDVSTYDHTYLGSTSIENATLHSDNTVYAQLTLDVGPEKVA